MAGFRAYCDFTSGTNFISLKNGAGKLELSPEESRHLCGSLRAVKTDAVEAFDLDGNIFACEISEASQKRAVLNILSKVERAKSDSQIYIAQCLPKSKAFEEIIRQSVEVGAAGIIPLLSEHTLVRFSDNIDAEKKLKKWRVHIIEAVKQSANFSSFELPPPQGFKDFLADSGKFDILIAASLRQNSKPILETLSEASKHLIRPFKACILIGPEGDLTESEYDAAESAGFKPVTLGGNVMKCDTAALCALSCTVNFFMVK